MSLAGMTYQSFAASPEAGDAALLRPLCGLFVVRSGRDDRRHFVAFVGEHGPAGTLAYLATPLDNPDLERRLAAGQTEISRFFRDSLTLELVLVYLIVRRTTVQPIQLQQVDAGMYAHLDYRLRATRSKKAWAAQLDIPTFAATPRAS